MGIGKSGLPNLRSSGSTPQDDSKLEKATYAEITKKVNEFVKDKHNVHLMIKFIIAKRRNVSKRSSEALVETVEQATVIIQETQKRRKIPKSIKTSKNLPLIRQERTVDTVGI